MNKIFRVFTFFYVIALLCWAQSETHAIVFKVHDVDPAFQPITNQFYQTFESVCPKKVPYQVTYYSIQFEDSPNQEDWVGVCMPGINGYTIYIDRKFWKDNTNFNIRQQLLFHELSHCVLGQPHSDNRENYMYPSIRNNMTPANLMKQTISNIQDYCNE